MKHDSDDEEKKEVEIPVIKEDKCSVIKLHTFFEQSEMDKEKCSIIFKVISTLHNTIDQIMVRNVLQKKITDFFLN